MNLITPPGFTETELKTLDCLVEGATDVHLAVENRNIQALYTFESSQLLKKDRDGETALHYAAINDDVEICKILINRNPDIIHITDVEDKTAYDWVREYNDEYHSHINTCDLLKKLN